jgi:pSer/pThr/pTyr-binding forkhead associated (FHA) protein
MALTIVVRAWRTREVADPSAGADTPNELSITLDAPRVIIGRGDGCEVRLPDPSVSRRHASLRQRGGEYVLIDEKSTNGTFIGRVKLPPEAPRVIKSGELIRIGRVWLELRVEPKLATKAGAAAAKELALDLVSRGLAENGEDPHPRVYVVEGPDKGRELRLSEPGKRYILGRGKDADLALDDPDASRRHVDVARKADALVAHDLGSKTGTTLDGAPVGQTDVAWRPGQTLAFGKNRLVFEYPAADALAEIERSPDEVIPASESFELALPAGSAEQTEAPESESASTNENESPTPTPSSDEPRNLPRRASSGVRSTRGESTWGFTDSAVVLVAVAVLALSVAGLWLLLGR